MRKPAWIIKTLFILCVAGTLLVALVGGSVYWYFSGSLPKIITVADYKPLAVTQVIAGGEDPKNQVVIGEFYKERRYVIPYEKISDIVVKAFISAEDDRFFDHQGINLASILRATIANIKAGHVVQGGSTITQQVAKSLLLTSERSLVRKVKEFILAQRIEHNLTKQQILYLYLNQIYLGHGAYGVQAASRTYFNKDVSQLTIAEAALLGGMPQAPGIYSPLLNSKKAKERQLYVLRRMYENRYITQSQMTEAAALPLKIFHDEDENLKFAPYLVEHIRRYLVEKYGNKAVYEGGMKAFVPTTAELARSARDSLKEGLRAVDKRLGYRGPIQRLKSEAEIEAFLKKERLEVIERRLHFKLFTADGRIDPIEGVKAAGFPSEAQLLEPGQLYRAVVTSVEDQRKSASVLIGAIRAELPLSEMAWAKPGGGALPSKILSRGDVIWTRLTPKSNPLNVQVALEQEPQVQAALFSVEALTGNVLAMEGGYDFEQSEFNRAIQAQRQPGSSFKPVIYGNALEKGFSPASVIQDSPIVYDDAESGKWKPSNFEEKFYGDTTFRQALIKSRNVPTIKIVQALQVGKVIDYAQRLGLNAQFNADLSISLGSLTTNLVEMTKLYALFPRLGRKLTPIFLTKVLDRDGKVLEERKATLLNPALVTVPQAPAPQSSPTPGAVALPEYPLADDPEQVMDPRVSYVMTHLMKEVITFGTGHEAKNLGRPAAGKTGTTNDYIDAWFMGFTPHVVTGVWVGNDSQKPIGRLETGAKAALPIWLGFMKDAVKGYPDADFTVPPGVVFASIDPNSGKLARPNASDAIKEAFIEGTEPRQIAGAPSPGAASSGQFFKEDIE